MRHTQEVEPHLARLIRGYHSNRFDLNDSSIYPDSGLQNFALECISESGFLRTALHPNAQDPQKLTMGSVLAQENLTELLNKRPDLTTYAVANPQKAAGIIEREIISPSGIHTAEVVRLIQEEFPDHLEDLKERWVNFSAPRGDNQELDVTICPGELLINVGETSSLSITEPMHKSHEQTYDLSMYVKDRMGNKCRIHYYPDQGTVIEISHPYKGSPLYLQITQKPNDDDEAIAIHGGRQYSSSEFTQLFETNNIIEPPIRDIVNLLILQGQPVTSLLEMMGITR